MIRISAFFLLLCGSAVAQGISPGQPNALATTYSPLSYGAVCSGSHNSVSSKLGINTIAALAAYKLTLNGVTTTPYSWITNGTWSSMVVPLSLGNAAATNATTFFFNQGNIQIPVGATVSGTQVSTSPVPTVTAVNNPSTVTQVTNGATNTIGTKPILVLSGTPTPVGSHPTPQTGLSVDDYVVSSDATHVTLKFGITAASIAGGTTLTFQPLSNVTISGSGLSGNKPALNSSTASTSASNYWVYFKWPTTDAMAAAAEMDWLGAQAAIEAATAASAGGSVKPPSGTCVVNNASVANSTLGGLIVHESTGFLSPTSSVDVVGNGSANTFLSWPTDMGAGRIALSLGVPWGTWDNTLGRYGSTAIYAGNFTGMALTGPSLAITPGVVNNWTTGMTGGFRRQLHDIAISNFYVGLTGETVAHTLWEDVVLYGNAIGLRLGPASATSYGNNITDHLESSFSMLADISMDKSALWTGWDINLLYCGASPKCIRLESGAPDNYGQPTGSTFNASTFHSVLAEFIGRGFTVDDNDGPNVDVSLGRLTVHQLDMAHVQFIHSNTYIPTGDYFSYWADLPEISDSHWQFVQGGIPAVSGQKAAIFISFANTGHGGDLIEEDFTSTLATYGSTPFFALGGVPFVSAQYSIRVCEPNSWCGHVEIVGDNTGVALGTPLEYAAGAAGAALSVQRAGGSAPFAGINMPAAGAVASNGNTIVATKFCYSFYDGITVPTSGTATALHWAKLASGGTITNATGPDTAGEVVIGTIMSIPSAGQAAVNIGNNGSCD